MKDVLGGSYRCSLEGPALVNVSINYLGNGIKRILIKSADNIKLGGTEYAGGQK